MWFYWLVPMHFVFFNFSHFTSTFCQTSLCKSCDSWFSVIYNLIIWKYNIVAVTSCMIVKIKGKIPKVGQCGIVVNNIVLFRLNEDSNVSVGYLYLTRKSNFGSRKCQDWLERLWHFCIRVTVHTCEIRPNREFEYPC